jgi:hypothetical protein
MSEVYNTASCLSSSVSHHSQLSNSNPLNYNYHYHYQIKQPTTQINMSDNLRKGLGEQASEKCKLCRSHF